MDTTHKYCSNHQYGVCNWLLPVQSPKSLCISCDTNITVPNLQDPQALEKWKNIEMAKHRVFYSLLKLRLNFVNTINGENTGLRFEFLASQKDKKVFTGHNHGLITLNIKEADPVELSKAKNKLNEKYRTLIGHFRHEIGHYYWEVLCDNFDNLHSFRSMFGDESVDYSKALEHYYAYKSPENWSDNFVSEYASAHPWEDWAETWAHYMHIMDIAETAQSYHMSLNGPYYANWQEVSPVYQEQDFQKIIDNIIPQLIFANALNNGMGLPSFYPFQLGAQVKEKLKFIHRIVWDHTHFLF